MLKKFQLTQGKHFATARAGSVVVYLKGGSEKCEEGNHTLLPGDVIECEPEKLTHLMDRFKKI